MRSVPKEHDHVARHIFLSKLECVTRIPDQDHAVAIAERLKSEGKIKVAVHGSEKAVDHQAAAQQKRRQGGAA
jgi:hypothetical protein